MKCNVNKQAINWFHQNRTLMPNMISAKSVYGYENYSGTQSNSYGQIRNAMDNYYSAI